MSELINNREHRIKQLKNIIVGLHHGATPESVEADLVQIVQQTDATEIAAMEQELIADGMPVQQIQSMCDLHAAAVKKVLPPTHGFDVSPGHPVDTLHRENDALREKTEAIRCLLHKATLPLPGVGVEKIREECQDLFNELMDIEKHYRRKENLLFSFLERHGIAGPSKVMWGKDDEIRALLRQFGDALSHPTAGSPEGFQSVQAAAPQALAGVDDMIFKEENILLPMAMNALTEEDWGEIWEQSPEYGWCIVEPREGYAPPQPAGSLPEAVIPSGKAIIFPTGSLTLNQLKGLFGALPLDITFVDAEDRVRYFSEGRERIFARSKAIIGRKVQHCHPPKSVDVVERILADFRSGRQDVAEFWIDFHGKFVHIRYFAVRDTDGAYLGSLELTQDLTRLRALQGERRLLQYESEPVGVL
jgi:uncharacterized protein